MGDVVRLNDPTRAFWLTRSVARTAGINLGHALSRGRITPEDYALMVQRCRSCRQTAACESWLGRGLCGEITPAGCRHAAIFDDLAR